MTPAHRPLTVEQAGERAVLAEVLARIPNGDVLLGPGDDSAVLAAPDGRYVVSTDTMIDGPDFRLAWSAAEQLGRKAVASNLADIVAMGARPTGLVVALALPRDTTVDFVARLAEGFAQGLRELWPGCGIVGGDLATSSTLTIAVTAFGSLDGRDAVTRAGAQPGDTLAVAGELGRAAGGLRLLFQDAVNESGAANAAALAELLAQRPEVAELISAQLAPVPPLGAGVAAGEAGATSMMDLSDGLLLDAHRLARASKVSLEIDSDALASDITALEPIFGADLALRLALGGGEDHSLLASFPAGAELPEPFRAIGRVTERKEARVLVDGAAADPAGWDPFAA